MVLTVIPLVVDAQSVTSNKIKLISKILIDGIELDKLRMINKDNFVDIMRECSNDPGVSESMLSWYDNTFYHFSTPHSNAQQFLYSGFIPSALAGAELYNFGDSCQTIEMGFRSEVKRFHTSDMGAYFMLERDPWTKEGNLFSIIYIEKLEGTTMKPVIDLIMAYRTDLNQVVSLNDDKSVGEKCKLKADMHVRISPEIELEMGTYSMGPYDHPLHGNTLLMLKKGDKVKRLGQSEDGLWQFVIVDNPTYFEYNDWENASPGCTEHSMYPMPMLGWIETQGLRIKK